MPVTSIPCRASASSTRSARDPCGSRDSAASNRRRSAGAAPSTSATTRTRPPSAGAVAQSTSRTASANVASSSGRSSWMSMASGVFHGKGSPSAGGPEKVGSTSAWMSMMALATLSAARRAALGSPKLPRWNAIRRLPRAVIDAIRMLASPAPRWSSYVITYAARPSAGRKVQTACPVRASKKTSKPPVVRRAVPRWRRTSAARRARTASMTSSASRRCGPSTTSSQAYASSADGWGTAPAPDTDDARSSSVGPRPEARWTSMDVDVMRRMSRRRPPRSSSTPAGTVDLLCAAERLSTSRTTVTRGTRNGSLSWTASKLSRTGPGRSRWSTSGSASAENAAWAAYSAWVRRPTGERSTMPTSCRYASATPQVWTRCRRPVGRAASSTPSTTSTRATTPDATSRTCTTPWSANIAGWRPGSSKNDGSFMSTSRVACISMGRQRLSSRVVRTARGRWSSKRAQRLTSRIPEGSQFRQGGATNPLAAVRVPVQARKTTPFRIISTGGRGSQTPRRAQARREVRRRRRRTRDGGAGPGVRRTHALLRRDRHTWPNPGSWWWTIDLAEPSDIMRVRAAYGRAIQACESHGVTHPGALPRGVLTEDPELRWLAHESQSVLRGNPSFFEGNGRPASGVLVTPKARTAWVDSRLAGLPGAVTELLAVPHVARRAAKVAAARSVDERHLFVGIGEGGLPDSLYVPLTGPLDAVPDVDPQVEEPLSHLWFTTAWSGSPLLRWDRVEGWSVHDVGAR